MWLIACVIESWPLGTNSLSFLKQKSNDLHFIPVACLCKLWNSWHFGSNTVEFTLDWTCLANDLWLPPWSFLLHRSDHSEFMSLLSSYIGACYFLLHTYIFHWIIKLSLLITYIGSIYYLYVGKNMWKGEEKNASLCHLIRMICCELVFIFALFVWFYLSVHSC